LKVQVIGGNGAFSSDNSSFIIHLDKDNTKFLLDDENNGLKLLFDCGPNAFHYIKENDLDIRDVYISHTHFDHIGGLEQLIFYNYFIKGNITRIYCADEVKEELEKILDINRIYDNGELVEKTLYMFFDLTKRLHMSKNYTYEFIKGNHVAKPNYGLLIKANTKALFISGDTKACDNIKHRINDIKKEGYKLTVFHDYSEWDNPYKNIHCCKSDFEYYYKDITDVKWYKYHNDDFNDKYKNKEIQI